MSKILYKGCQNDWENNPQSLGKICYDSLKEANENDVIMVEANSDTEITVKNLLEASVNLTKYFKEIGLTRNDIVSIVSENTWKYLAVVLAGFYTGIPINTINPVYNEGELEHCFSITDPKLVFCSKNALNTVLSYNKNNKTNIKDIILFDEDENENVTNFKNVLESSYDEKSFSPEDLDAKDTVALILFSSGTSGLPKAVQITHHNLRNAFGYLKDPNFVAATKTTVTIGLLPMFHTFGLQVSFTSILFGSKCIIVTKFKPDQFLKIIQDHKVTNLFVVPPLLLFLAKTPLVDQFDVSSVKIIACGAAPTGKDVEIMVQKRFVNAVIVQIYGLTESTGAATMTPLKSNCKKYGSAGVPVNGVTMKIVDPESKQDLTTGQVGEIYIKGTGIMKGYYKNLKETKETVDNDGYLKSGDLGYFDEDGYIFIVDRLKEIIKYKGFQVPPAELENLLLKHEGIAEAAVIGKPDERAGELPVAFIVKRTTSTVTEENIVQYIADHVSMEKRLHGGVVFVDEIPKNPSGKILRRLLRDRYKN